MKFAENIHAHSQKKSLDFAHYVKKINKLFYGALISRSL